jgi:hypothetical protein
MNALMNALAGPTQEATLALWHKFLFRGHSRRLDSVLRGAV